MAFGKPVRSEEALIYNSFEQLLEILADEQRKRLQRRKMAIIGVVAYVSIILLVIFIVWLAHGNLSSMGGTFGSIISIVASASAVTQTQRKAVQELANFDDVRAVPCLIEALETNDKAMQEVGRAQLPPLLLRMQASDSHLLSREHYAILNKVLKPTRAAAKHFDSRLSLAILKALQQIGDESSLPIVVEWAEGRGQAKDWPEFQQAAQECLPFLRQRVEHLQQTQTLLRASDGNITPVAMLLHPAMPAVSTADTTELLRAGSETEEPEVMQVEMPLRPLSVNSIKPGKQQEENDTLNQIS